MKKNNTSFIKEQLGFLAQFALLTIITLTVSRLFLIYLYSNRVDGLGSIGKILSGGFRIDVSLISQLVIIPCLLIFFTALTKFSGKYTHVFTRVWCWFFYSFAVFMEAVTPTFISEYDARPNRLFFEYLGSPNEVIGMLVKGYWLQMLLVVVVIAFVSWKTFYWVNSKHNHKSNLSPINAVILVVVIMVLIVTTRSGFQHRPINPAMVAFSNDSLINSLPLNSAYSLFFALYQIGDEATASKQYGKIDNQKMIDIIKSNMTLDATFIDKDIPTLHNNKPSRLNKKLNLIIVVEESLGAQFVGSLGGKPLTPNIDKWKDKSWFFNRLYATGTRSARGLEAITTGFLPSPARSVLKLPKAQQKFYTIAQTLEQAGYENTFVYGGESHFDNMKGFFLSNGFHQAIDQKDYKNPEFVGNWGVSDEDLFKRAMDILKEPTSAPKFTLVFSSSNHTPFEFPDNKIDLYDAEKQTVNNAVKYADYALGEFLDQLKINGYMENSIVMVVADHDARVMGDALVPVDRFHIPGFITGAGIEAQLDYSLISQIDLAPTLLSLLGIDSFHPMTGKDLTKEPKGRKGRAVMQYANNQAYMTEDHIVYLQPEKPPVQYAIKGGTIDFSQSFKPDDTALAHAQFSSWAYNNEKFKLKTQ